MASVTHWEPYISQAFIYLNQAQILLPSDDEQMERPDLTVWMFIIPCSCMDLPISLRDVDFLIEGVSVGLIVTVNLSIEDSSWEKGRGEEVKSRDRSSAHID